MEVLKVWGRTRRTGKRPYNIKLKALKISFIILAMFMGILYSGCGEPSKAERDFIKEVEERGSRPPADYSLSKWPEESRILCGSAPYPDAKLLSAKIGEDGRCRICFTQVSVQGFLSWLQSFAGARWYLADMGAERGPRKLKISYKNGDLTLDFSKDGGENDWPEELPAEICAHTPYFPFGRFESIYETEMKDSSRAFICVYQRVSEGEMLQYENTLLGDGYVYNMNANERRWFTKGVYFAAPHLKTQNDSYSLLIGLYNTKTQLLWPEALPAGLRNMLPASACPCTISGQGNTYRIGFSGMHLHAAADWFSLLLERGWTFSDSATLQNPEKNLFLRIETYSFDESTLGVAVTDTAGAKLPVAAGGFEDGLKGYDFALTKGAYSAKDVKKGMQAEFGKGAVLADFKELKALYGKSAAGFFDACGIKAGDSVWVQYGKKEYRQKKRYYLLRPANVKSAGSVLQSFEGNTAVLKTSGTLKLRVLVKVKAK